MKISKLFFSLAAIAALFFQTACKKEAIVEKIDPATIAQLQSNAQNALVSVCDLVYETALKIPELADPLQKPLPFGNCPAVVFSQAGATDGFPAKLTLDFGSGCTTARGNEMAGSISATFSGRASGGGTQVAVQFNSLKINGNTVSGAFTVTNGSEGQEDVKLEISDVACTDPEGKTVTIESMVIARKQVAGAATQVYPNNPDAIDDDVFEITANGKGADPDGSSFTVTTTGAMIRSMACRWLAEGKIEVKSGAKTAKVDFGDGTCDNKIEVTVAGVTKVFELK